MQEQQKDNNEPNDEVKNSPTAVFVVVMFLFIFAIAINKISVAYDSTQPVWFESVKKPLDFEKFNLLFLTL